MTDSRQRVLQAVNHREPDRVPIDFGGHRSSGIMAIAYRRLKEYLKIETGDIYVYDVPQQLAIVEAEVLDLFGVDTIEMGRGFALNHEDWREWVLPDGSPCKIPAFIEPIKIGEDWHIVDSRGTLLAIQKKGCLYFEQVHYPLADAGNSDFEDLELRLENSMWSAVGSPPAPLSYDDPGDLQKLIAGAQALRHSTDRAILGLFGGNLLETGQTLFKNDNFLALLAEDPSRAHRFLDRLLEIHLGNLEKFLTALGPYIDIIVFGDDFGMQKGPQISPRMYAEFFQFRQGEMWRRVKQLAEVKIMLHCCGGVFPLLPGLIAAGLEIINPVQTTCRDMEPERLKACFGKDLCFWGGGCNTRDVLPFASPEEVERDVRHRIQIMAPGGGFVFQQIHNVMADVPPANVVSMFKAAAS
jgi:uroporphyrinogen decarboxylase